MQARLAMFLTCILFIQIVGFYILIKEIRYSNYHTESVNSHLVVGEVSGATNMKVLRETIQQVLQSELHGFLVTANQQKQIDQANNTAITEISANKSADTAQAMQEANALVTRAISSRAWSSEDSESLARLGANLSQPQRTEIMMQIMQAIRRRELPPDISFPTL